MAVDVSPNAWFDGWQVVDLEGSSGSGSGKAVQIPLDSLASDLVALNEANADGDFGDIRVCIRGILARLAEVVADLAEADRPDAMTVSQVARTGSDTEQIIRTYFVAFRTTVTEDELEDET